jgi:hypothetical protein
VSHRSTGRRHLGEQRVTGVVHSLCPDGRGFADRGCPIKDGPPGDCVFVKPRARATCEIDVSYMCVICVIAERVSEREPMGRGRGGYKTFSQMDETAGLSQKHAFHRGSTGRIKEATPDVRPMSRACRGDVGVMS